MLRGAILNRHRHSRISRILRFARRRMLGWRRTRAAAGRRFLRWLDHLAHCWTVQRWRRNAWVVDRDDFRHRSRYERDQDRAASRRQHRPRLEAQRSKIAQEIVPMETQKAASAPA